MISMTRSAVLTLVAGFFGAIAWKTRESGTANVTEAGSRSLRRPVMRDQGALALALRWARQPSSTKASSRLALMEGNATSATRITAITRRLSESGRVTKVE